MKNDKLRTIVLVIALVVGYFGIRFVTQAGQGVGVIQNDGYGASGGLMLIVSGFVLGYLFATEGKNK